MTLPKIDDHIATTGATAEDVQALPREEIPPDAPYVIKDGRICRIRSTRDGEVVDPLCNFTAFVDEEVVLDDGAETTRAFAIAGQLMSKVPLPRIRVPAARFAGMAWVAEHWGVRAIVCAGPNTRDSLREAIQVLSPGARRRHIF